MSVLDIIIASIIRQRVGHVCGKFDGTICPVRTQINPLRLGYCELPDQLPF